MKKFLVFLVSIIVVICLGMTFYYFAKDEEVIKFKTSAIYINAGESISLDDLGFSHTDKKKETKINFNAGSEQTKSIISYNSSLNRYVSTAKGGTATIVITTNNRKYKRFEIKVTVGNGSEETPYHIYSEKDLFSIGTSKFDLTPDDGVNDALSAHYILMNNIELTESHLPIGVTSNGSELAYDSFDGNFNGNYYTISNLKIDNNDYGGLFGILSSNAEVTNLNIKNAQINGPFSYAGALAGVINGYVDRVQISDCNISSSSSDSMAGGLAGKIETVSNNADKTATVYRVAVESKSSDYSVSATSYVGGLAGQIINANIEAIKSATYINTSRAVKYAGGLTGYLKLGAYDGFVRESYSLSSINGSYGKQGGLFGVIEVEEGVDADTTLLGLYYDSSKCSKTYTDTDLAFNTLNSASQTTSNLKTQSTFVFYTKGDETIYWRSQVWKLLEGQFPTLKYLDNAIPTNIDRDQTTETPTDPDDTDNGSSPIIPIDPVSPSEKGDIIYISSKSDLTSIESFEAGKTYKVTANINMNGERWEAKKLYNASFIADSQYTISNFTIYSNTSYCGFFSSIVNSTVENIIFENITINITTQTPAIDYAGIVVGVVNSSSINKVKVTNSYIVADANLNTLPSYVGGMIGACTNGTNTISNSICECHIGTNLKNAGGFVGMTGPNTVVKDSSFTGSVEASGYLGGFTAQNKGLIKNCNAEVTANISTSRSGSSYIGGFVATNYNTVQDCSVTITNITISNPSSYFGMYAGGFAGYNSYSQVISNCTVKGKYTTSSIKVSKNYGDVFVAGLVANNSGIVILSNNLLSSIGTELSGVYSGGLVTQNDGGTIMYCKTVSDVYGEYVGGLAYNIMNASSVTTTAVGYDTRVTLKGKYVAGIACYISNGVVENCSFQTTIYTTSNDSISAGAVIDFPVSSDGKYATIQHCIFSNEFAGIGNKYLACAASIFSSTRCTGTITKCVFDTTCSGASSAYETGYDKKLGKVQPAASNSSYTKATASNLYKISTYTDLDFSIMTDTSKTWRFYSNKLPQIVELG